MTATTSLGDQGSQNRIRDHSEQAHYGIGNPVQQGTSRGRITRSRLTMYTAEAGCQHAGRCSHMHTRAHPRVAFALKLRRMAGGERQTRVCVSTHVAGTLEAHALL